MEKAEEERRKIRKKPVVVSTDGRWFQSGDIPGVVDYKVKADEPGNPEFCKHCLNPWFAHGWISILEGGHIVCPGDWIIVGVKGERVPVGNGIFRETYASID